MGKWILKGCPRCKGDLFYEKDQFGNYLQCLQCGFMQDVIIVKAVTVNKHGKRKPAKRLQAH